MADPLSLILEITVAIIEASNKVNACREECEDLRCFANRTSELVRKIGTRPLMDQSIIEVLNYLTEALKRAQAAIFNCRNANWLTAMLSSTKHSDALKQAAKNLERALSQVSLALCGTVLDIQNELAVTGGACNRRPERFDEPESSAHHTIVSGTNLVTGSARMNHGFEGLTRQTQAPTNQTGLNPNISEAPALTVDLVTDISRTAGRVKTNKLGCMLLTNWVERASELLRNLDRRQLLTTSVLELFCRLNNALSEVKQSVVDCCNADMVNGRISYDRYSAKIEAAALALEKALYMGQSRLEGMPHSIQSALYAICNEIYDARVKGRLQRSEQWSRLHSASYYNQTEVVKKLIDEGADVNLRYSDGAPPLFIASQQGHIDIVKELIARGADVNLQKDGGFTPLYIASQKGHITIVKELIKHGANVHIQTDTRWTPLVVANHYGHVHVVQVLSEYNAS